MRCGLDRRALLLGGPQRGQRVDRLAALTDGHDKITGSIHGISTAHLARDLDERRQSSEVLHPIAPHHARVCARPARDEAHALDLARHLRRKADLVAADVAGERIEPPANRVFDGARLLVDLLEHEVLVAVLLRFHRRPRHVSRRARHGGAVEAANGASVARERGHFAVLEEDELARVREQRRNVAGAEHFSVAQTDDERVVGARHDDLVGRVDGENRDGVSAAHAREGGAYGMNQRYLGRREGRVEQVREDLAVRVAAKARTTGLELLPQGGMVFDDAVVDERHLAGRVRVRVVLAGASVRRPARMADPGRAREGRLAERRVEVGEFAHGADDLDPAGRRTPLWRRVDGDARRVVAAILEALQAVHQNIDAIFGTDITDDAAHIGLYFKQESVHVPVFDGNRRAHQGVRSPRTPSTYVARTRTTTTMATGTASATPAAPKSVPRKTCAESVNAGGIRVMRFVTVGETT